MDACPVCARAYTRSRHPHPGSACTSTHRTTSTPRGSRTFIMQVRAHFSLNWEASRCTLRLTRAHTSCVIPGARNDARSEKQSNAAHDHALVSRGRSGASNAGVWGGPHGLPDGAFRTRGCGRRTTTCNGRSSSRFKAASDVSATHVSEIQSFYRGHAPALDQRSHSCHQRHAQGLRLLQQTRAKEGLRRPRLRVHHPLCQRASDSGDVYTPTVNKRAHAHTQVEGSWGQGAP